MITLAVVFVICLMPMQIFNILTTVAGDGNYRSERPMYYTLLMLCILNCCVNPFIYAIRYDVVKTGIRRMCNRKPQTPKNSSVGTEVTQE